MQSSLNALEMPKHISDTRGAIKGQIIGGTAGAIISYEKNKEAKEKKSMGNKSKVFIHNFFGIICYNCYLCFNNSS